MKVLFDQGVPAPLRHHLSKHNVGTAYELGWSTLGNGDLLDEAEKAGYEVFVTTDKNIVHQQNLAKRRLAVLVLPSARWPNIQSNIPAILDALENLSPRDFVALT